MNPPLDRKIVDVHSLIEHLRPARAAGRTVVHCHGCFDIVHPGHIRYLRFARELGDILVVSLTGDYDVGKGPDRPYIPQELRAENLAALEFVDWVVIDPHPTAAELLQLLRPDVYVKGREYAQRHDPRFQREREIVEGYGGRVVYHSGDVVFSSTQLIRSLDRDGHLDEVRLRTLCGRADIHLKSFRAALEAVAGLKAVVVGDLIRERYVLCDASEAAEDAPVLSLHRLGGTEQWGGAAATALQLQALGASTALVTATARNDRRGRPEAALAAAGVELRALPIRQDVVEHTTYVADDAKLFRVRSGTTQALDSSWEREAAALISERLKHADLLVWCDCGYGLVAPGLVAATTPAAREAGLLVAGHVAGPRADIGALCDCDLLCVSERRLREAMHDMSQSLPTVVWHLLGRTRGKAAIVSLHKRGLIGFDASGGAAGSATSSEPGRLRSEFVPALAVHYADLLGAEEAILATATLILAAKKGLPMAIYAAAGAAGLAASRAGFVPVTAGELHAWAGTRAELRSQSHFLPDAATAADLARLAPPLPPTPAAEVSAELAAASSHGKEASEGR